MNDLHVLGASWLLFFTLTLLLSFILKSSEQSDDILDCFDFKVYSLLVDIHIDLLP